MRRFLDLAMVLTVATALAGFVGCSEDDTRSGGKEGEGEGEGEGGVEGEGEGEGGVEGEGEGEGGVEGEGEGEGGVEGEGEGEGGVEGEGEGEGPDDCETCGKCVPDDRPQDYGGWCGPTRNCNPEVSGNDYSQCLNEQCRGVGGRAGICLGGFCTRQCSSTTDCRPSPNNTWVDGPQGSSFTCWGSQDLALCLPGGDGTRLTECMGDSECGEGESCQIGYDRTYRHLIGLCMTDVKCGAAPGEFCNEDVYAGDLVPCQNGFCLLSGTCTQLCVGGPNPPAGECDWSPAVECYMDLLLGGDSFPNDYFNICLGKSCQKDGDCGAEDFWCGLTLSNDEERLEGMCTKVTAPDGAGYGEACNDDPLDAVPDIECARGLCVGAGSSGSCASICQTNAECDAGFACQDIRFCLNEACTETLSHGLCLPWPGSQDDCRIDSDCTQPNEHCAIFSIDTETEAVVFKCRENEEGGEDFGEECGGPQDIPCYNDLCYGLVGEIGFCSKWCETNEDCGEGYICYDVEITEDGLTSALCLEWPGSQDDCTADSGCPAGEHCALFTFDEETEEITFKCRSNVEDGAAFGAECDVDELGSCYNNLCLGPRGGEGYCSRWCQTNEDCGEGYICDYIMITEDGLTSKVCWEWPGSQQDCTVDAGCPEGEHCALFAYNQEMGEVVLKCRTDEEDGVGFGEACGGPADIVCYNDYCFGEEGRQGYCSKLCETSAACGDGFLCVDLPVTEEADVFASFCVEMEGSLQDCSADFVCPDQEGCTPLLEEGNLVYKCTANEGQAQSGEDCVSSEDCVTGFCFYAGGGGYCTELCNEQNSCPDGLGECLQQPIEGGEEPRTVGVCTQAGECHNCHAGMPCAGGNVCTYTTFEDGDDTYIIGTCVVPCAVEADCAEVTAGEAATSCQPLMDADGQPTEQTGCISNNMLLDCGYLAPAP